MSDFSDIKNRYLRAYNRAAYLHNLLEDVGKAYAEDYLTLFSKEEKEDIKLVTASVRMYGTKAVINAITNNKQNLGDETKDNMKYFSLMPIMAPFRSNYGKKKVVNLDE